MKTTRPHEDGEYQSFFRDRNSAAPDKAQNAEGWVALCARAAVEQDPKKLLELVSEINRLLDARRKGLANEAHDSGERGLGARAAEHGIRERGTRGDGTDSE